MKITRRDMGYPERIMSAADAIEDAMNGRYNPDVLGRMQERAEGAERMVGKLVGLMVDKGMLSPDDVQALLKGTAHDYEVEGASKTKEDDDEYDQSDDADR